MSARRALRRALILGAIVATVAWLATAATALVGAAGDVAEGALEIAELREGLDARALLDGDATEQLERARDLFASAHDRTSGALLAPARILPWVGRQIRSAAALSAAAEQVADTALGALAEGRAALDERRTGPSGRLAVIRDLGTITEGAFERLSAIDLGPADGLVGALSDGRAELDAELSDATERLGAASAGLRALGDLLEGPRSILVAGANNAEMRAGSGMFLTVALMRTKDGAIDLGPARSVTDVNPPRDAVRVRGDFAERWGWLEPSNEWRNLMLTPRFEESAPLALRMWAAAGGRPVDGVLAMDPVALEALMRATGPVRVDGRRIEAGEVLDELLYRQYVRFAGRPTDLRRAALGTIAHAVFDALRTRQIDPVELLDAFADATSGRHLMIWSAREDEQAAWERLGVDGSVGADSMMLSVLNRGGNKLDRWLRMTAALRIEPDDDGADGILRVRMRNLAPRSLPAYIDGPNPAHRTAEGEYRGFVAVTLPGFAGGATIEGGELVAIGSDGPTRVVAAEVRLQRGARATLTIRFRMNAASGTFVVEPSARVPATTWTYDGRRWPDRLPRVLEW